MGSSSGQTMTTTTWPPEKAQGLMVEERVGVSVKLVQDPESVSRCSVIQKFYFMPSKPFRSVVRKAIGQMVGLLIVLFT